MKKIFSILMINILLTFSLKPALAQVSPILSVSPATQSLAANTSGSVAITVADATDLGSYEFEVAFDPNVLQVSGVTNGDFLGSTGRSVSTLSPVVDNTLGTVKVAAFTLGSTPAGPTGSGTLAVVSFTTKTSGSSALTLQNIKLTDTVGILQTSTANHGTVSVATTPSPSVSPLPVPSPSPSPTTAPTSTRLWLDLSTKGFVNEEILVNLNFETAEPVLGVDAIVNFDPQVLEVVSIDDLKLLSSTPKITYDNSTGVIKLSQVVSADSVNLAGFIGTGSMARIHFKALKATSSTNLSFQYAQGSTSESNAISASTGLDILTQPANSILEITNHASVKLTLTTPSTNTAEGHQVTGTLTAEDGSWTKTVTTDATGEVDLGNAPDSLIGKMTNFFFKVSGFLTKKITTSLQPGFNLLSFGLLKAGDLNDDGIINGNDVAILYQNWFTNGAGDVNKDGSINTADYFVVVGNLLETDEK